jgi:hypothetical protein
MTHTPPLKLVGGIDSRKPLGELTAVEMKQLIESLRPKEDMHAGVRFLLVLLEEEGPQAVIRFVDKMAAILDKEGKLLNYDFQDRENDILKGKTSPSLVSRRTFLRSTAWTASGAVFAAHGAAGLIDQIGGYIHQATKAPLGKDDTAKEAIQRRSAAKHVYDFIGDHVMNTANILVGAALINEGVEKWREAKLEQVANAVAEIAKYQRATASAAASR